VQGPAASLLLVVAAVAYLLAPGHPLALLRGVPLDWLGVTVLVGLASLLFGFGLPRPSPRDGGREGRLLILAAPVLVVLVIVKVLLGLIAPTYGLAASYYPRPRIGGTPERSTEQRAASYTRVEASPGEHGFGLHFFNDIERFNYYEPPDPDRRSLPFAVRWEGYLQVPVDGEYPLALTARGLAVLSIDGAPMLTVGSRDAEVTDQAPLSLSGGAHAIQLDFTYQGGAPPSMRFASAAPLVLTAEPVLVESLARDRLVALVARGLDLLVLAGLLSAGIVAIVRRARLVAAADSGRPALLERPLLAGLLLAVLAYALVTTSDLAGRAVVLEGGQDWLTYESYARDILLNGPLMTLGEPIGKGKPYFFQPFYPYYLAGLHWLTGEGLWGPIVLQIVGDGVAGILLYYLGKRLFGTLAGVTALALFLALGLTQLDWIARKLLSENLYFVVLPAAMLLVIRAIDERRLSDVVWGGLLLGVASITRAPTLLFVPGAALIVALAWRRPGQRDLARLSSGPAEGWRRAALAFVLLGLCAAAVAALVPLRNHVVSGRPALVATNGGATLLLAHRPTDDVRLSGVDEDPLYDALKLDRPTREVVEFIRQDPGGYVRTLVPLGLYSIGVSGAVEGFPPLAPDILLITGLYVLAVVWLPDARTLRTAPLHLFIVIHLAIMVTFLPYVYGYRQVLPMQLLMLAFDGALLARVAGRLRVRRPAGPSGQTVMEQRTA
jgi:hypothetical protein